MRLSCYLLIITALFYPIAGRAGRGKAQFEQPTLRPSFEQFQAVIRKNYNFTPNIPLPHLRKIIGKTEFLPIDFMRASQMSFGFLTAEDKISRAKEEYGAKWDPENGKWLFDENNDKGRSLFSEKKNAVGVLGPDGIYIVDGHHKILTSLYYGATTYPITLIEDLSQNADGKPYSAEQFRKLMIDRGHVFLTRVDGTESQWVPFLHDMSNDPNRYFITLITTKLKVKFDENGRAKIKNRRGSDEPVLIKIGRDAEFFEMEFAKRLHRSGIHYNDIYRDQPPFGFIQEAARVLWEMREAGDTFLQNVLMFPSPRVISTEDLENLLNDFLHQNPSICSTLLTKTDKYF